MDQLPYLNTSHVNVKSAYYVCLAPYKGHLNTSHVNVKSTLAIGKLCPN